MRSIFGLRAVLTAAASGVVAAIVGGCSSTSTPPAAVTNQSSSPAEIVGETLPAYAAVGRSTSSASSASNARAYRMDAATHLYGLNRDRIYRGRMPPMLYAIGVLQVEVDGRGNVRNLHWMRAPRHAPEVVAEIERTVRAAAPFPTPSRMGKVVYTDTWLWHKSGHFQLDTLTEGQD